LGKTGARFGMYGMMQNVCNSMAEMGTEPESKIWKLTGSGSGFGANFSDFAHL